MEKPGRISYLIVKSGQKILRLTLSDRMTFFYDNFFHWYIPYIHISRLKKISIMEIKSIGRSKVPHYYSELAG
jgi:hypothetical protein